MAPVDGVDLPSPAKYQYRATIPSAALSAYGQTLGWILEAHSPAASKDLDSWFQTLCANPTFKAAVTGDLDTSG